ncbi:unnamed protein product [Heterobilharzia americana]|nr:unnamed protein product [Heterobilharzia americana]CAH8640542.1 unnamed protein product [Heterobilharzia americana]
MQAADILVHYAVRENHSGVHLNGSCSESLVDSLVASSSSSRLCTNDSSNLGIRKALNELYSSVCPTLSGGGGCRILTPVLSSVPESLTSSDNACCENGQKNPVRLYVGHQSNTSMDCSNHLLDNHLNPNSIASQSPRSSVTHNGDSMLNRNDVLLSHSSDSHSNGISDNGDTLSQQFDGMYCALGNHFSLPLSEADKPRRSSLLIQPCTGFATTSQLVSCTNPVCDTFLDAHMLQSLRSPGVPSTNVKQVTTNSIYNLTSIPSFLCNENSDEHDPGNTYFRQLSSSKSETIDMTSFPAVTSCLNAFPVEPLSLVTHSNYLKKPKRQGVVNKKSRTNTSNRSSCLPSVCDSSTDRIPVQDTFSESSKGHAKRSRNLTGRGSLTFPGRISRSGCNNEDYPLVNEQSYFADSAKRLLIKSESLMADDIDDASDHSESLSAGTGCAVRNNTPASSLDEVEQHHLKLERKRARNRVAARRCRERKLSLIRSLENQVAERDAQVRSLEDTLARYRAEGERLRLHIEMLARSYPNLKAELYRFPFLFQLPSSQQHTQSQQPSSNQTTPIKDELPDTSSSHFT